MPGLVVSTPTVPGQPILSERIWQLKASLIHQAHKKCDPGPTHGLKNMNEFKSGPVFAVLSSSSRCGSPYSVTDSFQMPKLRKI